MDPYVLDTNVLIYYLEKEEPVFGKINEWIKEGTPPIISTITEAELLAWPNLHADQIEPMNDLLGSTLIISIDSPVARMGALFRRQYGTQLIDALIAATAFLQHAPLVTRNTKDFAKIREIKVLKI